jgi:DNA-binding transcriptional regulator YiaG
MPNIATVLKNEISRIARREIKADTEGLKKQSSKYRSEIAALKRQILDLQKSFRGLAADSRSTTVKVAREEVGKSALRFRSKGFAAHRQRLGLSAAQAGALLGVSGQTIYHWEAGKAKPRASQMPRIDALRKLTKKRAAVAVAEVMG